MQGSLKKQILFLFVLASPESRFGVLFCLWARFPFALAKDFLGSLKAALLF